jgi:hypothetical protein
MATKMDMADEGDGDEGDGKWDGSECTEHPLGHYWNCSGCGQDLKDFASFEDVERSTQCGYCDGYWCPACTLKHWYPEQHPPNTICGCFVDGVLVKVVKNSGSALAEWLALREQLPDASLTNEQMPP